MNEERAFTSNVFMVRASAALRVRQRKENLLIGAVAFVATQQKVFPIICQPIIAGMMRFVGSARLLCAALWSVMFNCEISRRSEYQFTVAALVVLDPFEHLLYGRGSVDTFPTARQFFLIGIIVASTLIVIRADFL